MKKLLMLVVCFMLVEASSFAEPAQEWELGAEVSYILYDEPNVMEEEGIMYGISSSYAYRSNYVLKAEGRFAFGQVDYTNSGTLNDIDDYIWEFRGLVGWDWSWEEGKTLTPYIGIGYRYLLDDLGGLTTSTGARGYDRESEYFYSPIGVETIFDLNNGWLGGVTIEYDYFWKGQQTSHYSQVNLGYNDLENDQNDGYGVRGSIKFIKEGETVDILIEPFIRYWDIDQSENANITYTGVVVGYGYEPENNSTESGVKIAVRF